MHIAEHASPGGISIHALLAESDSTWPTSKKTAPQFLSTLSLRRATSCGASVWSVGVYFYPRSPCGERRQGQTGRSGRRDISIHALLAESDSRKFWQDDLLHSISIHALLAESDGLVLALHRQQEVISIHALLAESDFCLRVYAAVEDISIHALLAESDFRRLDPAHIVTIFLSTLSLRRATSITVASVI